MLFLFPSPPSSYSYVPASPYHNMDSFVVRDPSEVTGAGRKENEGYTVV